MQIELEDELLIKELQDRLKQYERLEQNYKIAIGKMQARRVMKKEVEGPEMSKNREALLQENLKEVVKRIKEAKNVLSKYNGQ